jgi:hypothetical protein
MPKARFNFRRIPARDLVAGEALGGGLYMVDRVEKRGRVILATLRHKDGGESVTLPLDPLAMMNVNAERDFPTQAEADAWLKAWRAERRAEQLAVAKERRRARGRSVPRGGVLGAANAAAPARALPAPADRPEMVKRSRRG